MTFAMLEKEFKSLSGAQQNAVALFVQFLATQNNARAGKPQTGEGNPPPPEVPSGDLRQLGGFENGFYMAPDFDEPIADFAEYM